MQGDIREVQGRYLSDTQAVVSHDGSPVRPRPSVANMCLPPASMAALQAQIVALLLLCANELGFLEERGWRFRRRGSGRRRPALMAARRGERNPDGLGWRVYQILGIVKVPPEARYKSGEWMEKLFTLKQKGVEFEGLLAWALHIAAMREATMYGTLPPMLDSVETLERVAAMVRLHSIESSVLLPLAPLRPGRAGVAHLLGMDIPTAREWSNFYWVKTLFELQERGVQLAAFQAWGDLIVDKTEMDRRQERIPIVDLSDCSSSGVIDAPETSTSQEVDGPAGPQMDGNTDCGLPRLDKIAPGLEEAMKRELRLRYSDAPKE